MGGCFSVNADESNDSTSAASAASSGQKGAEVRKASGTRNSPPNPTPNRGTCDKRYKFGKELGQGAYSTVFLASDLQQPGPPVAIKRIKKSALQPHDHQALRMEVSILAECDYPHILKYVGFFDEEKFYYLVTEVVSGGELFDRIVEKTVYDEHEARELIRILLQTLEFLHVRHIAHRDLKPENLLLESEQDDALIKLADFGFATYCDGKSLNQVCGTPDYVAPEIVSHEKYGIKCDIWSAGVIAYILLGGYPPFQSKTDNRDELFRIIKSGKFRFHDEYWRDVSDDAKDLIANMLVVDPDTRPSATHLLQHKWILEGEHTLRQLQLPETQTRIKEFNAKRKFKGAAKAVMAMKKLEKATSLMAHKADSANEG